jgi:membrane-anchored protein YejM (alkaline phosphatase superfamily)
MSELVFARALIARKVTLVVTTVSTEVFMRFVFHLNSLLLQVIHSHSVTRFVIPSFRTFRYLVKDNLCPH